MDKYQKHTLENILTVINKRIERLELDMEEAREDLHRQREYETMETILKTENGRIRGMITTLDTLGYEVCWGYTNTNERRAFIIRK